MYPDVPQAWPPWNTENSTFYYGYLLQLNNANFSRLNDLENSTGYHQQNPLSFEDPYSIHVTVLEIIVAILLSGFIIGIVFGNCCVVLSVVLFREMRTITNGLIVSLATADLLVAIFVLPISLYHEVVGIWTLGPIVCDFWITSDVFCCTSSILNIVVIALDR